MRILMVSWKDLSHPRHGGAEVYTELALRELAHRGHDVVWFTSRSRGALAAQITGEGIEIVRRGSRLSLPFNTWRFWRSRSNAFDIVVDQVNTYPMFTALYVPHAQSVMLIHQLAREVWETESPWLVGRIGRVVEPRWLRLYRRRRAVTVSESTASDLRELGFTDVRVVENALSELPPVRDAAPASPLFVGVGRLVRMKAFEEQLEAIGRVREVLPQARLVIIGRGSGRYPDDLQRRVDATPGAELLVDASDETKDALLSAATAVLGTSIREGWGLMVTEGHAHGTPSVVYDRPGLRDSTTDDVDGLIVPPDPSALAAAMVHLVRSPESWARLSAGARASAEAFTPERLGEAFESALRSI
jgi:glycosyltransferase involved in cell wall biosynthesis